MECPMLSSVCETKSYIMNLKCVFKVLFLFFPPFVLPLPVQLFPSTLVILLHTPLLLFYS